MKAAFCNNCRIGFNGMIREGIFLILMIIMQDLNLPSDHNEYFPRGMYRGPVF